MEKEIQVNDKTYRIKELTIEEGLNFDSARDPKEATFDFASKCLVEPKLSSEELKKLPFKEGLKIITEVNKLNGLTEDFQKPVIKN